MQIAIFPSCGIGDGLIFLTLAYNLHKIGHEVHIYHKGLMELKDLFPSYKFFPLCDASSLSKYDRIICQNDNTEKTKQLILQKREILSIFYPTYKEQKHGPLTKLDRVFDPNKSMADNIIDVCKDLFQIAFPKKQTGIKGLDSSYRKYKNRVLIHPTSTDPKKNWPRRYYLKLSKHLEAKGFDVFFILGPKENFPGVKKADCSCWKNSANYIHSSGFFIGNDSGPGHLASLLGIPTLIISDNEKRLNLWRPGFFKGQTIAPPNWIPNIKGLRLRENKWFLFIPPRKVLKLFTKQYHLHK